MTCEPLADGLLQEPVAAVSSLAFVLAGMLIAARYPRPRRSLGYPALVAGIGVGSFYQHGPDPAYSDLVHDLPLAATLAFVAADSAAALLGRPRPWWWWALPTLALVPLILAAPRVGDLAQVGVAGLAVALTLVRARAEPSARRPIGWAVSLLAVGGLIGTLSEAGRPLCVPDSLWQGHAAWHVLAAAALVMLAPVVQQRPGPRPGTPGPGRDS